MTDLKEKPESGGEGSGKAAGGGEERGGSQTARALAASPGAEPRNRALRGEALRRLPGFLHLVYQSRGLGKIGTV